MVSKIKESRVAKKKKRGRCSADAPHILNIIATPGGPSQGGSGPAMVGEEDESRPTLEGNSSRWLRKFQDFHVS